MINRTKNKFLFSLVVALLAITSTSFAQYTLVDSLLQELSMAKPDTNKINLLNLLSQRVDNEQKSFRFAREALVLSVQLNNKKGKANAYQNMGNYYFDIASFDEAKHNFHKAANAFASIGDKRNLAKIYRNISDIYAVIGSYDKALSFLLRGLSLYNGLQDKTEIAHSNSDIGKIYYQQKNYKKALDYFHSSYDILLPTNNFKEIAQLSDYIGKCLLDLKIYDKALNHFENGLKIRKKNNFVDELSVSLTNLGITHKEMGNLDQALAYSKDALSMVELKGDKEGIIQTILTIGEIYSLKGRHNLAERYLNRSELICKEQYMDEQLVQTYQALSYNYQAQKDFENALKYYQQYITLKEQIINTTKAKQFARMEAVFQSEKKEKEIELLNKENEIKAIEINRTRGRTTYFLVGMGMLIALIIMILRSFLLKKKANELLRSQKKIIEKSNKNITSSIEYSRKIQEVILPDKKDFFKILPNSFVLFKPKDIVTGDFYFFDKIEDILILAVIDCTGHGVPGAFMSLINFQLIQECISVNKIIEPAQILAYLHHEIILSLKKEESDMFIVDGMDLSVCAFNMTTNELSFSSSGRPFVHISDGELNIVKGGRFPIGLVTNKKLEFTTQRINLKAGDSFYLFTDGYDDQFGGETKESRMTKRRAFDAILANSSLPIKEQKQALIQFFDDWKKDVPQTDDVCMIGVEI